MTKNEYSSFEKELSENGRLIYTNVGVSMLPLIRENRDVMVIERLCCEPKKLDAVLFRRDGVEGRGKYVVHRILKIRNDEKYFIVGDNCTEGELVERDRILGVLTCVFRDGKKQDFTGFGYSLYLHLWCAPYHLRFFILRVKRGIKYLFSAVRYKLLHK